MQKRSSKGKDTNQLAASVVAQATGQIQTQSEPKKEKNPAAVALGRLGGLKGGNARAIKLTTDERKRIATEAAKSRWKH